MTGETRGTSLFCLILLLLSAPFCKAQKGKEHTAIHTDSLIIPIPTISVNNTCTYGIATIAVNINKKDSSQSIQKINLYKKRENINPTDTAADTLIIVNVFSLKELEKQNYIIIPKQQGEYAVRFLVEAKEIIRRSPLSQFVTLLHCSSIVFNDFFDKEKTANYTPQKLVNIQITEFIIFDRTGETVYTHNNNTVLWNGTYPNEQQCPNGIYYYHCKYIDMAQNSSKKSLSGMVELKNRIK